MWTVFPSYRQRRDTVWDAPTAPPARVPCRAAVPRGGCRGARTGTSAPAGSRPRVALPRCAPARGYPRPCHPSRRRLRREDVPGANVQSRDCRRVARTPDPRSHQGRTTACDVGGAGSSPTPSGSSRAHGKSDATVRFRWAPPCDLRRGDVDRAWRGAGPGRPHRCRGRSAAAAASLCLGGRHRRRIGGCPGSARISESRGCTARDACRGGLAAGDARTTHLDAGIASGA